MCGNNPHYVRVGLSGQHSRGSEKMKAQSRLLKQVAGTRLVEGRPPAGLGGTWITSDRSHGQEAEGKAGDRRIKRRVALRKTSERTVCRRQQGLPQQKAHVDMHLNPPRPQPGLV